MCGCLIAAAGRWPGSGSGAPLGLGGAVEPLARKQAGPTLPHREGKSGSGLRGLTAVWLVFSLVCSLAHRHYLDSSVNNNRTPLPPNSKVSPFFC